MQVERASVISKEIDKLKSWKKWGTRFGVSVMVSDLGFGTLGLASQNSAATFLSVGTFFGSGILIGLFDRTVTSRIISLKSREEELRRDRSSYNKSAD